MLSERQIKAMPLRGVTVSLPQAGIECLFVQEKYIVRNLAAGQCAVHLYPNHQYNYVPTGDERKRLSVTGERLAELLGMVIKPTTDRTTLSRRIVAIERRMGIENAKQLGKVLAEMEEQNMHTAADYEKTIQNLVKKQMSLTNEISLLRKKVLQTQQKAC